MEETKVPNGSMTTDAKNPSDVIMKPVAVTTSDDTKKDIGDNDNDDDDVDADMRYGCFGCKPTWLQCLNNIVGAVTFLSFANCFQSMANGVLGVILSTIEKRFDLSSSASSWIASAYEIGPIPILIIISYFGTRIHRPQSCAIGLFSVAIGCVLFFIPQFTTPVYRPGDTGLQPSDSLCAANRTGLPVCEEGTSSTESYSNYLPLFIIARLLIGMGSTPILTLGVTYMDDCSTKEKFATYCGVFNAMSVIGPALAFIGGGLLLEIFVDFYEYASGEIGIDSDDSRWIGAWWLPFTIAAALSLLNAIPMFGYPADLPGAAEIRHQKVSEAHSASKEQQEADALNPGNIEYARTVKEFKVLAKGVFTNPTWILLTIFACTDNFIIAGFTAFGPKLLEVLFALSPTLAGTLFGVVLLPAGAGGTIIGGLLIEKLRMSCTSIIRLEAILAGIVTAATFLFLLSCDPVAFAGVSVPYVNDTIGSTLNLTSQCNVGCSDSCVDVKFEPVCSVVQNIQFYSPCHAGCHLLNETRGGDKEYVDCSCISTVGSQNGVDVVDAVWGTCTADPCTNAILFLVVFFFAVLAIFICLTMNMTATLRCVTSSQSSFAISVQVLFIKLLGTIPGPLFMGLGFDVNCILWQDECGVKGSCMAYDIRELALTQFYICFSVKLVSLACAVLAVFLYKPPKVDPVKDVVVLEVTAPEELGDVPQGGGYSAGPQDDVTFDRISQTSDRKASTKDVIVNDNEGFVEDTSCHL